VSGVSTVGYDFLEIFTSYSGVWTFCQSCISDTTSMLTTSVYSAIPVTFCYEGHMACILCVLQAMKANLEGGCFECRRHCVLATTPPFVRLSKIENLVESLMNTMFPQFQDNLDATGLHRLEWQKRRR